MAGRDQDFRPTIAGGLRLVGSSINNCNRTWHSYQIVDHMVRSTARQAQFTIRIQREAISSTREQKCAT